MRNKSPKIRLEIVPTGKYFHLIVFKNEEILRHFVAYGEAECEKLKNSLEQKIHRGDFTHQKTFHEKVARYVQTNQLQSFMNNTKWKELREAMDALEHSPAFIVKYLLNEEQETPDFEDIPRYAGDWSEDCFSASFAIEWLKIHAKFRSFQGHLLPDAVADFSDVIQAALEKHHIPYEKQGDIFTIFGYKQ